MLQIGKLCSRNLETLDQYHNAEKRGNFYDASTFQNLKNSAIQDGIWWQILNVHQSNKSCEWFSQLHRGCVTPEDQILMYTIQSILPNQFSRNFLFSFPSLPFFLLYVLTFFLLSILPSFPSLPLPSFLLSLILYSSIFLIRCLTLFWRIILFLCLDAGRNSHCTYW